MKHFPTGSGEVTFRTDATEQITGLGLESTPDNYAKKYAWDSMVVNYMEK